MDDPDALRLVVAAAVRLHVARCLGPDAPCTDLLADARRLRVPDDGLRRTYGLSFTPAYPGATAGPGSVRGGRRLVLACLAHRDGGPAATVLTTLILGRPARVAAAPPTADWVPPGWAALDAIPDDAE